MFCDFPKYKHLKQTIFRGPGGGGNATSDSEVNLLTALSNESLAYAEQAALEAGLAAVSAAAASGSAFDANASAVAALASETEAALSESAAAISASNALASENTATTQAGIATTQAGLSAASAAASDASATASAVSAAAALVSEGNAATSASTATTQAGIATTKASDANTSALAAASSATASAGSATSSQTSADNSAASAVSAASSASSAAALLDNFDDRYLGPKASAPSLDNDGNALLIGALYFDTVEGKMRVYTSVGWTDTSSAAVASLVTYEYVATEGQTTFSGADVNAISLDYTVGGLLVSLNGTVLRPGDDYTASTGTSIVLVSAAVAGDELQVHAFNNFSVANTYTKAEVDANKQDILISGTNIKTINSESLLGAGDIVISVPAAFPAGTAMLFMQTAAPTGWTKSTAHDNKALRVVSGTAGSGGSAAFTTAFGTPTVSGSLSGTVGATTLSTAQMPSHTHAQGDGQTEYNNLGSAKQLSGGSSSATPVTTAATGGGGSHTHSFSGSLSTATAAVNVAYVDAIIATKD